MRLLPPVGTANMQVPCGSCLGCRKRKARDWALRCLHEAQMHEQSVFVTLTYDDAHLPANGFLSPDDLRLFLMRVRNAARRRTHAFLVGERMRYFSVGEYGGRTWRAHYHALLFGVGFSDGVVIPRRRGKPIFNSDTLRDLWGKGNVSFAPVNAATASYAAQYSLKKLHLSKWSIHDENGEVAPRPFLRVSTNPGIGFWWLWRHGEDARAGVLHQDGQPYSLPRYYQEKLKRDCPDLHEEGRACARASALAHKSVSLEAAERIAERRLALNDPRTLSEV